MTASSSSSVSTLSRHSYSTSRNSFSLDSSSTSVSSAGSSIPHDQRPRLVTPALKTPTYPHDTGVTSMVCATTIHAPLPLVVSLLLDARTYPYWNSFAPAINISRQPNSTAPLPGILAADPVIGSIANNNTTLRDGTGFSMEVILHEGRPYGAPGLPPPRRRTTPTFQVTALEQFEREDSRVGVRLAWRIKGKVASLFTRSERVQEFVPGVSDDGKPCVEYVCWETYYAMLAGTINSYYGSQLETGYAKWMDGLKEYAEEQARSNPW